MELGALQAAAELYVGILAVTILVAATNAGVLGVSRLVYSMGMHRQMPDGMRRLHPRFRTPYLGILAFSAAACLALLPGPGRLPRRDLRVRRDALVLDGAPRGAAAAGHASPTSRARTAAPGGVRIRGHDLPPLAAARHRRDRRCRCSSSARSTSRSPPPAARGWRSGCVVYVVYRRRQGLDLVSTHKVAIAEPVVDHEAEYDSVLVHVGDDRYDERLIATAAKLAAQRRRGIHVLVTITVPNALEIDAPLPEAEAAADSIIEQARLQGGRRVTGHWEKVRAGQQGRRIIEEARDMRAAAVVLPLPRRIAGTSVFGKTLETVLAERPCRVIIESRPPGPAARACGPRIAGRRMARRRLEGLERVLGVNALFSTAYGNVGSSIYYALGLVASYALGLTPVVFIITGFFFFCTAASYAEATAMFPEAGGSSSFARRAFNEFWSFFAAWAGMLTYTVTIAISAFFVPHYIGGVFAFAESLRSSPGDIIAAVVVISLLAAVNVFGAKESTGINVTLAVVDFLTQLLLVAIGAVLVLDPSTLVDNVQLGVAPAWSDFILAIPIGMLAYTGIETVSNMAEEAKDETHTIPEAINRVRLAVFAIYFTLPAVALSALPVAAAPTASTRPSWGCPRRRAASPATRSSASSSRWTSGSFQNATEIYVGLLAATILFLATNAGIIGVSRLVYSMGIHRQMPDALRRLHPKLPDAVDRDHRVLGWRRSC